jgi:hypothetical protein
MELREYNGWENKLTWLVHLHLSSEEHLMNEMTSLVANTPIGYSSPPDTFDLKELSKGHLARTSSARGCPRGPRANQLQPSGQRLRAPSPADQAFHEMPPGKNS